MSSSVKGRIVVGVDGSRSSVQALRWAAEEAEARRTGISVVCCWTYPPLLAPAVFQPPLTDKTFVDAARQVAKETVEEALGAGLEHPHGTRRHADGVQPPDFADLVVDRHPAGSLKHDVHLLVNAVAVCECRALPRTQPLEADAETDRAHWLAGEPRFAQLFSAGSRGQVIHFVEIYDRKAGFFCLIAGAAERLEVHPLKTAVADEVEHLRDSLAGLGSFKRGVQLLPASPQLGHPHDVGIIRRAIDHIQLAARSFSDRSGYVEQLVRELVAFAGLGHRFGVASDGAHRRLKLADRRR